ncbi:MAG: exopolyphosphatase/guanosine-5'-triphosphate,3'-diphosphate pyrophosphatase [Alphaproteobacteria bacterium]|jgi:exopolyphosphatase/guanosine-5'-triphosphate,3'-diphosphate pyrophosphatase
MKLNAKPKFIYPNEIAHKEGRFAVIDIGSSTIRLVVYDTGIYPHLFLNHKVRTMLAKGKGSGVFNLEAAPMERTLSAIEWFLWVCKQSAVTTVVATATSAVREAENGDEFVKMVQEKTGLHIEVIGGEVEARLSALGGVTSLPNASGVVMDLGGGSLDICTTERQGDFASLPLGGLSLQKLSDNDPFKAVEILKKALSDVNWMANKNNFRDLVALGSGMRSIASLHMIETGYPMHILHDYSISKDAAIAYCAQFLRGEISEKVSHLAKGYEDIIPYRAAALTAMLEVGDFDRVRFASFGIREGIFFSQIENEGVGEDPLLSFAKDLAIRDGRGAEYAFCLAHWAHEILPTMPPRLLQVAALFADVAWREQYAYRASSAFEIVYGGSFVSCSHKDRAKLALIAYFTHADELEDCHFSRIKGLVSDTDMAKAKIVGALFHLAAFLDPGAKGMLSDFTLQKQSGGCFSLEGPAPFMRMESESVAKRLEILNKTLASQR